MKKKIIIVYLCSPYVPKNNFIKFIKNYKRYKSGINSELLICYKNLTSSQISFFQKKVRNLKYKEFFDETTKNDFDIGTFRRVAIKYNNHLLFFMDLHAYPVKKNWLKYFYDNYKKKTIIASTGSYQSISSNARYRTKGDNYILFFYKIIKFFILFPLFPNPHFRTTNFLISAKDFLSYDFPKDISSKEDTWCIESGRNSMYYFFKKKKFKIYVVNSDNKLFSEKDWPKSETYAFKEQSKKIMSDNHERKYSKLNLKERIKKSLTVWGYFE